MEGKLAGRYICISNGDYFLLQLIFFLVYLRSLKFLMCFRVMDDKYMYINCGVYTSNSSDNAFCSTVILANNHTRAVLV